MTEIHADDSRYAAVIAAIQGGEVEKLRRMLEDDRALATARLVDDQQVKRTLLHVVTDWPGHFPNGAAVTAALIDAGAEVNAPLSPARPNGVAETPLHWAASSDDVPVLDALLDGGADIEAPGAVITGGTPMSDAVVFAQWNAARRLVGRGAQTTLWQASALGLLDRVHAFFSADAGPSDSEVTNAFWNACRGGQLLVAEYLLERGADPNWIGHDHKTPLQVAQESGADHLISWLRSQGAG
jgi:ankyrin repeat protein